MLFCLCMFIDEYLYVLLHIHTLIPQVLLIDIAYYYIYFIIIFLREISRYYTKEFKKQTFNINHKTIYFVFTYLVIFLMTLCHLWMNKTIFQIFMCCL